MGKQGGSIGQGQMVKKNADWPEKEKERKDKR